MPTGSCIRRVLGNLLSDKLLKIVIHQVSHFEHKLYLIASKLIYSNCANGLCDKCLFTRISWSIVSWSIYNLLIYCVTKCRLACRRNQFQICSWEPKERLKISRKFREKKIVLKSSKKHFGVFKNFRNFQNLYAIIKYRTL